MSFFLTDKLPSNKPLTPLIWQRPQFKVLINYVQGVKKSSNRWLCQWSVTPSAAQKLLLKYFSNMTDLQSVAPPQRCNYCFPICCESNSGAWQRTSKPTFSLPGMCGKLLHICYYSEQSHTQIYFCLWLLKAGKKWVFLSFETCPPLNHTPSNSKPHNEPQI